MFQGLRTANDGSEFYLHKSNTQGILRLSFGEKNEVLGFNVYVKMGKTVKQPERKSVVKPFLPLNPVNSI